MQGPPSDEVATIMVSSVRTNQMSPNPEQYLIKLIDQIRQIKRAIKFIEDPIVLSISAQLLEGTLEAVRDREKEVEEQDDET